MTTQKKPTLVQIEARRKGMEKLFDSPGGREAIVCLLAQWMDSYLLYEIMKKSFHNTATSSSQRFDFLDAVKTWAEQYTDKRLADVDELLDDSVHIRNDDEDAVYRAADALGMPVWRYEADHDAYLEGNYYAVDDPRVREKLLDGEGVAGTAEDIAKAVSTDIYAFDALESWLGLYGIDMQRRKSA